MECNLLRGHQWVHYRDGIGVGKQCSRCGIVVYNTHPFEEKLKQKIVVRRK